MNLTNIHPDQAWQMALEQLQLDMSKASFDTWVRDTEFVSFENGNLTVATQNDFAQQWLTSRLVSTVNRMLTGILNQPVTVQFVVHERPFSTEEREDDGSSLVENPEPEDHPKVLTLQAEYKSAYDEIVQPDHVIVFPGYFLRYIPLLGPELAWLYIGFRQAAYEAGATKKLGKKFGAPAKKIARYSGMSPRTFWRWAARPDTWKRLSWLVKPVEEQPRWISGSDGHPHRATHTYRVAMSLPLLPFDELSLRAWLYHHLASGKSPLAVIEEALETPAEEIIPLPETANPPGVISGDPHSIQDVLFAVCGLIQESEQKQFKELSDKLAQHLMVPRDLVFLTHYFVCRWLPRLNPGPGWFVTLMRDRCYFNQRTGEIRDEIQIAGGYSDLAGWLGLRRIKTVWEWLRSDGVAEFVIETGRGDGPWETATRGFKVCLGEPLTKEDQSRAHGKLTGQAIGVSVTHRSEAEFPAIGATVTHSGASDTHSNPPGPSPIGAIDTHSGATDTHSNPPGPSPIGASDMHSGATDTHSIGATVTSVGASDTSIGATVTSHWRDCHRLNSLTPLKHPKNLRTTPSEIVSGSIGPKVDQAEVGVGFEWNLGDLLSRNRVSSKNQAVLLEKGLPGRIFVSWLLYSASKNGAGIRDPIGHAVSRLMQNSGRGAGGAFDRLSNMPANELAGMLSRELQGQSPWNSDWRAAMEGASHNRLRSLADQLGVPLPVMEYR